jgi:hypothetical protein
MPESPINSGTTPALAAHGQTTAPAMVGSATPLDGHMFAKISGCVVDGAGRATASAKHAADQASDFVQTHPLTTMALLCVASIAVGALVGRKL